MKPEKINTAQSELFKSCLSNQLNPKDPLFILANQINWSMFEEAFGSFYKAGPGQPPKPIQHMVGLMMLQHMHGLSDEQVVHQWVQNPYWQYFCGYDYLQWELSSDPSSMPRWRNRLGPESLEKILAQTIVTDVKTEAVAPQVLIEQAFVDKGYKGHGVVGCCVYISGQKRGMTRTLKKHLKRRSAIEPHFGHPLR